MSFYEQIAPYYDYIFPAGQDQCTYIKELAGKPPKKLLDIACGTGVYSIELAREGYEVWATDVDTEMVRRAEKSASDKNISIKTLVSDMLNLDKHMDEKFHCVFCIGNSIVHLGSKEAILAAVLQMKERLSPGGSLLLQIINFDRIFQKGITSLPTIVNENVGLEFQRNYVSDPINGLIHFDTILTIKDGNREDRYENRVDLFPVLSSDFREILDCAGFESISFYGGFNKEPYITGESFMLVANATVI